MPTTSAVEPLLDSRRSRREAAARQHARHVAAPPAQVPPAAPPAISTAELTLLVSDPEVAAPATRRALRAAIPAAEPVTAAELLAEAEAVAPARRQRHAAPAEGAPVEPAAAEAEVVESVDPAERVEPVELEVPEPVAPVAAPIPAGHGRRARRVAATTPVPTPEVNEPEAPAAVEPAPEAPAALEPAPVVEPAATLAEPATGFCHDTVVEVPERVEAKRAVAEVQRADLDVASVALTLSRLAVAATAFAADVRPLPTEDAEQAPTAEAAPPAPADSEQILRRVRARERAQAIDVPPIPSGPDLAEALPIEMVTSIEAARRSRGNRGQDTASIARQWVPRLAVLSALGAATVVAPVMAAARTVEAPTVPAPLLAEASALDALTAEPQEVSAATAATDSTQGAAPAEDRAADTAEILAADQLAELRSTVTTSRSQDRTELPVCGEPSADTPNGVLAALDSSTEYVSLSMPVQEGVYRLTSSFGPRWGSTHMGQDFAAPPGTPIHAIADGTVIYAGGGKEGRSGMLVIIESEIDGETVESWYIHMYPDGVFVSEGDTVQVGEVIGEVGSYGNSTGPHLHLEIHTGDLSDSVASAVDPLEWLQEHDATPVTSDVVCS